MAFDVHCWPCLCVYPSLNDSPGEKNEMFSWFNWIVVVKRRNGERERERERDPNTRKVDTVVCKMDGKLQSKEVYLTLLYLISCLQKDGIKPLGFVPDWTYL